jgi:hypothetical protein
MIGVWYCSNNDQIFLASPFCYDGVEFGMFYMDAASGRCYLLGRL